MKKCSMVASKQVALGSKDARPLSFMCLSSADQHPLSYNCFLSADLRPLLFMCLLSADFQPLSLSNVFVISEFIFAIYNSSVCLFLYIYLFLFNQAKSGLAFAIFT